ncbi:Clp protease N-terminal domain-containing protein [Streptomyces sp. SID10815]|uniref:Clp protease N-terminal domain-containing protein n=1 Tax=Streptomyces sp. SID10815 TaxID=2706027 RepID=UPI0031B9C198
MGDVHDRIPGQPAHDQDDPLPGDRLPDRRPPDDRPGDGRPSGDVADDAGLSAELAAVLAAARRRAVRDGDRQTDTAHLLHTLLESDPEVRAAVGGGPRLARLLGYLVQRSIGYGLRWQSTVEDSCALPVVASGNAAASGAPGAAAGPDPRSPLASAALENARARAARRGREPARGVDLLAALLADPRARAVEVLARAGIDARELAARLDNDAEDRPGGQAGSRPEGHVEDRTDGHAEDARTAC